MSSILLLILQVFSFALIGRALMSWVRPQPGSTLDQIRRALHQITDPVVIPVRNLLPQTGGFDFSVFAVLIVINFVLVPLVATF